MMQPDRIKTVASLVTISGALLFLYFSTHEPAPKFDLRPHEALGLALAEETAKLAGGGGRITLITRDTSLVKNPYADSQVKGFQEGLRKARLALSITNLVKQDPLRIVRVPSDDFFRLMKKQTEADVIASLLGPPLLNPDQRAGLNEKWPRIAAVCSGDMPKQINLKELFQQNLLQVAIIGRASPGPEPAPSTDIRAWFNQLYEVVTPANLSELPLFTNTVSR